MTVYGYPDPERLTVDLLAAAFADRGEHAPVAVGLPATWTKAQPARVQVAHDGTPVVEHPVVAFAQVRVTCWGAAPDEVKRLAQLAHGLLLAHPGDEQVAGFLTGTGVLPGVDPDSGAAFASFTVRARLRGSTL